MFRHGKTGKIYYSINEKISYYKRVIAGEEPNASVATKRKAKGRLKTLERLSKRDFAEPEIIITDDKKFGDHISKPRACVVVEKNNNSLRVAPLNGRETKYIILDKNIDRQISNNTVARFDG